MVKKASFYNFLGRFLQSEKPVYGGAAFSKKIARGRFRFAVVFSGGLKRPLFKGNRLKRAKRAFQGELAGINGF